MEKGVEFQPIGGQLARKLASDISGLSVLLGTFPKPSG